MNVAFVNHTSQRMPKKFLVKWLKTVKKKLLDYKIDLDQKGDLVIVFLKPAELKKINRQFRKKDYVPDILSFDGHDEDYFGELLLCPQVVKKQAHEHDISYQAELAYLVLHGILHLLGYEHEQGGEPAKEMFAIQDQIFTALQK